MTSHQSQLLAGFGYTTLASAGVLHNMGGGGPGLLWIAHASFVVIVIAMALGSDLVSRLVQALLLTPAGASIVLFLSFYVFGIIALMDTEALGSHLRTDLLRSCLPGVLLGCICLLPISRASWAPPQFITLAAARLYALTATILLVYIASRQQMGINELRFAFAPEFASGYQSFSAYLLAAFCLLVALLVLGMTGSLWRAFGRAAVLLFFLGLFAMISALTGSKKEALAMALIGLSAGIAIVGRDLRVGDTLVRGYLTLSVGLVAVVGAVAGYVVINGLPAVALLNYGSGINLGSLMGRLDIVQLYGLEQVAENPLLGSVNAELISGPNLYLHSLLSIQTHLGLVGTLLFSFAVGWSWFKMYTGQARPLAWSVPPGILFVCLIGAFFTWYPLWVTVGLMIAATCPPSPSRLANHNATSFA